MALYAPGPLPSVRAMPQDVMALMDEVRCLRLVVESLVVTNSLNCTGVAHLVRSYDTPFERASWRLTYLMALEEAAKQQPQPAQVLSRLPIGL